MITSLAALRSLDFERFFITEAFLKPCIQTESLQLSITTMELSQYHRNQVARESRDTTSHTASVPAAQNTGGAALGGQLVRRESLAAWYTYPPSGQDDK